MFDPKLHSSPRRSPLYFAGSVATHVLLALALALFRPVQAPAPAPPVIPETARVVLTRPPRLTEPKAPVHRPTPRPSVQPLERARVETPRVEAPAPRQAEAPIEAPHIEPTPAAATLEVSPTPTVPEAPAPPKPVPGFVTAGVVVRKTEPRTPEPQKGLFSTASTQGTAQLQVEAAMTASAGFGSSRVGSADGKPGPTLSATGGFGGVSARGSSERQSPAEPRPGGFAAAESRRASGALPEKPIVAPADLTPVRILAKPDPIYTAEARALRLEGDIVLEAVFTRDGRVDEIRVVRGLGHGLDEAAVVAVRGIDFEPARRGGVAEDARLRLTVRFQLAY